MKINRDTKKYLQRKWRTIQSRKRNLNSKRISDFPNEWEYEKWYTKQSRTISTMDSVLQSILFELQNKNGRCTKLNNGHYFSYF